jgi:YggT family protein
VSDLVKQLLETLVNILIFAIFGRIIISWLVLAGMRNEFLLRLDQALSIITDPIMRPLRRIIPPLGMIDITPMVALIVLYIIRTVIVTTL